MFVVGVRPPQTRSLAARWEVWKWVSGVCVRVCVCGVGRWRLWGLNKTPERIKWKSFCCNHAAVLDLAAWLMKEAECCNVERNY